MTQSTRSDFADLPYFLALARRRSFRQASLDLGISSSALSHSIRGLETRMGVRLFNRTTRSVTLTAAGEELAHGLAQPFEEIATAVDRLNAFRDSPSGRVRINVPGDAATHLLAPVLPEFIRRYPDIHLDVAVTNRMVDIVEAGFDAGIRYGGTVPEDMVAQRLSADVRWVVVASPAYIAEHGRPEHPTDLMGHQCLQIRTGSNELYAWEFDRGDETVRVAVPGAITLDETQFAVGLVERGAALSYIAEPVIADRVAAGAMEIVLEDWASMGPGLYAYYSSRRQVPTGLRLLIDLIREVRPWGL